MSIKYFLQQSKNINNHFAFLASIGYESYDEVENKDKIASFIIKELGNDVFDVLYDSDMLSNFNDYLISASQNDAVNFADSIKDSILNRYHNDLCELFDNVKHSNLRMAS